MTTDNHSASAATTSNWRGDIGVTLGLAALFLFFVVTGLVTYNNTRTLNEVTEEVSATHSVITLLDKVLSLLKDAETGQRGYLLTGKPEYLVPYNIAKSQLSDQLKQLEQLFAERSQQKQEIPAMKAYIANKMDELQQTIALHDSKGEAAALALVLSDRGKDVMDELRAKINDMQAEERRIRQQRLEQRDSAFRLALGSGIATSVFGLLLSVVIIVLLRRSAMQRRHLDWLQNGQVQLGASMFGEQQLELLGQNVLSFFARYTGAQVGAFFARENGHFRRFATYGVPADAAIPSEFKPGDGLLGQVAKENKALYVQDVPANYLSFGSAFGQASPRHLIIAPGHTDGMVNTVIELGFLEPVDSKLLTLLDQGADAIGMSVRSAVYRSHLQNLLQETQRQAEELQAQGEELRVSNEELEEQSRALKESQGRLEQQQAELEQTNSQLEEQTQLLELQKQDLEVAKESVMQKARELEQASQYKSDFLANMSHELRTPLNSSLILAKLLADNPNGNLSDEQVKYAQTIQSSGNDLLALINDILDLSKIEAGHMEMQPEIVPLSRLASDITRVFQPLAEQKGLTFTTRIAPDCPPSLETDRLRFEQVLKNLLSNAIKFTPSGTVELYIANGAEGVLSFSVTDSGIGISREQQASVFEAFRQADGTISRKYGGTGLGLSISRELTRLLGGQITLQSAVGKGSTFTVTLPEYFTPVAQPQPVYVTTSAQSVEEPAPVKPAEVKRKRGISDDRDRLNQQQRSILVVEDDDTFARILYDLVHELDFQCLVASTAEEALATAKQYLPSAVILDVGLPDHSGLSVLDRLKNNPRTRHIPVHVVSGEDHTQVALSLGAIGYMLKPVKREALADALRGLEGKLSQDIRKVLIVEDDPVQLESVRLLLKTPGVETYGVGSAAECLEQLRTNTYDCMILDLSLPDASGYSLLETLSHEDAYAFPPVIVYTGKDLSQEEEQRLRKYSRSIIIKGAKSPERLLDEVTLFLHKVVADLPQEQQRMLEKARNRDALLEGRRILAVEDDIRNVYALTSILEPRGALVQIARNGVEALELLEKSQKSKEGKIDLVLMDVMMPEMDGMTCTREIRKRPEYKKLPIIMLTAKAMKDDQERCLAAGANDYMAKPLDVEKLLSLVRVWMPR